MRALHCFIQFICTPDRRQSDTLLLSMNVDKKIETTFSIAIFSPNGNKRHSKTLSRDFCSAFIEC